jgi:hypothetical protein
MVNSYNWAKYVNEAYVRSGKHEVAIAFTNDHHNPQKDRTLYLDKNSLKENR